VLLLRGGLTVTALSLDWRRGSYLSAAARAFRDFAIDHFRHQLATE
jgi:hypothetical protein